MFKEHSSDRPLERPPYGICLINTRCVIHYLVETNNFVLACSLIDVRFSRIFLTGGESPEAMHSRA